MLPQVALLEVAGCLGTRDRVAMGQVCAAWRHALGAPCNWRSADVVVNEDLPGAVAGAVARHCRHVRCLRLAWRRRDPAGWTWGGHARAAERFLAALAEGAAQLRELHLVDWAHGYNWGSRPRILRAVAAFLRSQEQLQVLKLCNTNFSVKDAARLVRRAGGALRHLGLCRAFGLAKLPPGTADYLGLLRQLHGLAVLELDYSSVSGAALGLLAGGSGPGLRALRLAVDQRDVARAVPDAVWGRLAAACPALRVSITVVNISNHEDLLVFLLPSIPLHSFSLSSGAVWNQNRSRKFRHTLRHILNCYWMRLVSLHLNLRNNMEVLDDLILEVIESCPRLLNFKFEGILYDLHTIKDICDLHLSTSTNFQKIQVHAKKCCEDNKLLIEELRKEYTHKLSERNVYFKVE
ncbi:F-box/LRR-repeat protein 8-like [Bacillus rossius redtenbacheri]|uniref:F-box/LRR-repeat protein 8-like n=1 Tax=Bacillus rossius redtenbacheri TaxID=93214 RepID=UPI002FDEB206